MKQAATTSSWPTHLQTTVQLLRAGFPKGMSNEAYLPLLALLGTNLSDRNLADVMAHVFSLDRARVLHDIYRSRSTDAPSAETIEKVRQRLLPHGYVRWQQEE
jgi:hypothetical protein